MQTLRPNLAMNGPDFEARPRENLNQMDQQFFLLFQNQSFLVSFHRNNKRWVLKDRYLKPVVPIREAISYQLFHSYFVKKCYILTFNVHFLSVIL